MAYTQAARALASLRAAVKTAREATEKAERELAAEVEPGRAAQAVLHALAWGHANAMSNVETALAAIEDMHTIRALEAKQAPTAAWFIVTRSGEALNPQLGEPSAYAREHAAKEGQRIVLLASKGVAS
jgi:hypothetical protein